MYCKKCGQKLEEGIKFCPQCGAQLISIYEQKTEHRVEKQNNPDKESSSRKEDVGLAGWLILVGLGLVVTAIWQLWSFFADISIFTDKDWWETLNSYNKFFGPIVFFEEIFCLLLAGASIYLLVLYFKRDSNFPMAYIIFLIVNAAYLLLDYLFISYLSQHVVIEEELLSEAAGNLGRGVVMGVIWITYMSVSKRVKATFIN